MLPILTNIVTHGFQVNAHDGSINCLAAHDSGSIFSNSIKLMLEKQKFTLYQKEMLLKRAKITLYQQDMPH